MDPQREKAGLQQSIDRLDDPVLSNVAERIVDRVLDCQKHFTNVLLLGGCHDVVAAHLAPGTKGIEHITHLDSANSLLQNAHSIAESRFAQYTSTRTLVHAQQEHLLEHVPEQSFDLVIACLGLHWANDLPGTMVQARRALKPDGFFLSAIFGEETVPVCAFKMQCNSSFCIRCFYPVPELFLASINKCLLVCRLLLCLPTMEKGTANCMLAC